MYLKSLTLTSFGRVIRDIHFHAGLNLIVDETLSADGRETGNNVGKTTVLMLVDFCLGAKAKGIYTDPENKKEEHKLVKDFLVEKKVLVSLVLIDDLSLPDSRECCIERNFLARKDKIQRIDGVDKTDDDFEKALSDLLTPDHYPQKPTFRQLISHNIRYKDLAVSQTLKTLDGFTRDDEYETLYLFMLGCQNKDGDTKQELRAQIRIEDTFKKRLEKDQTLSGFEAALSILDNEIMLLEERKSSFNLNPNFAADLDNINQLRYRINLTTAEISKLELRQNLIEEARDDLQSGVSHADTQQLQMIYQQATALIDRIQKSFDDLLQFHNQMIAEKVRYITKDLPKLGADIKSKKAYLQGLLADEAQLAKSVAKGDTFAELETTISALNEKYRKKGEYENTITQLKIVDSNLKKISTDLDAIDSALFSDDMAQTIKIQKDKFNHHFAAISQELYGEQYALKVDPKKDKNGKRVYSFTAFNVNFSSGKKQGEISCFDIAYTLFADQEGIPCMHFLLNDKKELMHDNQLIKIANLVNRKGIQFVASILKDKLPEELNQDAFIVLKLSQNDKLFRIENG